MGLGFRVYSSLPPPSKRIGPSSGSAKTSAHTTCAFVQSIRASSVGGWVPKREASRSKPTLNELCLIVHSCPSTLNLKF